MKIDQICNLLGFSDHTSLDIHWSSFVSRLHDFQAWIRILESKESITPMTTKLMNENLDMMFDRYKDLWDRIEKLIPEEENINDNTETL